MTINNNSIGVLVIARDEERRLDACLASIIKNEGVSLVVVIDSRTMDSTADIARRYTDNVVVEKGERGHLRNKGVSLLDTSYVATVDADEQVPVGYFEKLRSILSKDERLGVLGAKQVPIKSCLLGRMDCEYLNYRKAISTGNAMYKRIAIQDAGGFNPVLNVGEDGDLHRRIILAGWKMKWTDATEIYHEYSSTSKVWRNKVSHGSAAGLSWRGFLRLILSLPMGLHAALSRGEWGLSWYVPYRAWTLFTGPGMREAYVPKDI